VWALPAWARTADLLTKDGHTLVGVWTFPAILAKHRGRQVPLWYLRTFGILDTAKLAAFATVARLARRGRVRSFADIAAQHGAQSLSAPTPNASGVVSWLVENEIDVALIAVSFVLGKAVLGAPVLGTINKHAAMLPANRGLFPYFWAKLHGTPQGVSYHLVTPGIDEGATLARDSDFSEADLASMVAFYVRVFRAFPEKMLEAVRQLDRGSRAPAIDIAPSYFGLPSREDVARFRARGGRIIRFADVLSGPRLWTD
jgi:folate-dependent phosphoribosylglycinamide formyltransferase PurN